MVELPPPRNLGADLSPVLRHVLNEPREQLPVVHMRRCYSTHSGIALRRFQLVEESVFRNVRPDITRHFHRYALYKYFTERRLRSTDPRLLLLHHHWSSGYHHWLTECLLKVQFIDPSEHVVVLPEDYPAFARESLAMYPFAGVLELPAGRALHARSLTLVGNPNSGHFDPDQIRALRTHILEKCHAGTAAGAERIYITRSGEQLRRVENEDHVISTLQGLGFEVVDPRTLSFTEQVRVFSGCKFLVSVHGAGLTNCVFMPEGSGVLELYRELAPQGDGMNACYWRLSTTASLDYYCQFCAHGENRGPDVDRTDVLVDIDELKRNVEGMLANERGSLDPR